MATRPVFRPQPSTVRLYHSVGHNEDMTEPVYRNTSGYVAGSAGCARDARPGREREQRQRRRDVRAQWDRPPDVRGRALAAA